MAAASPPLVSLILVHWLDTFLREMWGQEQLCERRRRRGWRREASLLSPAQRWGGLGQEKADRDPACSLTSSKNMETSNKQWKSPLKLIRSFQPPQSLLQILIYSWRLNTTDNLNCIPSRPFMYFNNLNMQHKYYFCFLKKKENYIILCSLFCNLTFST